MIAVIDNYDSFTYNLVQHLGELGADVRVFRNDAITADELDALDPSHVVISPGPGCPADAGVSNDVIRQLGPRRPLLGVCLGHQCIGEVFGGNVVRASRLMHGKTSRIYHHAEGIFAGLSSGAVIHQAVKVASEMEEGNMVVVLPDGGWKYMSLDCWDGFRASEKAEGV